MIEGMIHWLHNAKVAQVVKTIKENGIWRDMIENTSTYGITC